MAEQDRKDEKSSELIETAEPLDLARVLSALGEPVRLQIIAGIMKRGEAACSDLELPVTKATASHHFRVLREAGVIATRQMGTSRISFLRTEALDREMPGLLEAVLNVLKRSGA